jgi:hypothetical protein
MVLGVKDSSKTYENKVVSHKVVPKSDLNGRQIATISQLYGILNPRANARSIARRLT